MRLCFNVCASEEKEEVCPSSLNCDSSESCIRNGTSWICQCAAGFEKGAKYCENIDECKTDNNCHSNAACLNTYGSYICKCKDGFTGNGTHCEDKYIVLVENVEDELENKIMYDLTKQLQSDEKKSASQQPSDLDDEFESEDEDVGAENNECNESRSRTRRECHRIVKKSIMGWGRRRSSYKK